MIQLPPDFLDFLKLLNLHKVEYLLIGGYAVAYHGYVRATGDMGIFVGVSFEECYSKRKVLAVKNVEIPVIGIEELIRNKKASARDKDLLDVNRLE